MKKSLKLSAITAMTVVSFIGCGSSNSSSNVKTGTGYYIDSAVQGVNYICGSKKGTTDKKGTFTFEEGKECKFTLAGIPLRTTKANELKNGGTILEDNPKVAKFLQSIDADNNLSDGIQITDKVLTALTTALKKSNSVGTLPKNTVLTEVVANVAHDVPTVSADVRTDAQVQAHLTQTQTGITKELLAGKTFYHVGVKPDGSVNSLEKNVVNATATVMISSCIEGCTDNNGGTTNITIVGNSIVFEDGSKATLTKQTSDYLLFEDSYGKHYSYGSEAKAKAYYDSLATSTASTAVNILAGKTFYVAYNDNGVNTVERHIINADATHDTRAQVFGQSNSGSSTIAISGDIVTFSSDNSNSIKRLSILEVTDKYIKIKDADTGEIEKVYLSLEDAKATFDSSSSTTTPSSTLSDLIVGKTYYVSVCNSHEENGKTIINNHVETIEFNSDGSSFHISWIENGETKNRDYTYSVDQDTLTLNVGETVTYTGIEERTNGLVSLTNKDMFYKNKSDAEANLNSCSNSSSSASKLHI